MYTVLSEAVCDAFYLTGLLSEDTVEKVKCAISLTLVYLSGSWFSTGVALGASSVLSQAGFSNSNARIGGQAIALALKLGQDLSPMDIGKAVVGIAAGKLGFWAKKQVAARLASYCQKPENEPAPKL